MESPGAYSVLEDLDYIKNTSSNYSQIADIQKDYNATPQPTYTRGNYGFGKGIKPSTIPTDTSSPLQQQNMYKNYFWNSPYGSKFERGLAGSPPNRLNFNPMPVPVEGFSMDDDNISCQHVISHMHKCHICLAYMQNEQKEYMIVIGILCVFLLFMMCNKKK